MSAYFFVPLAMIVMYLVGAADKNMITIADPMPIPVIAIPVIALFMGLLSIAIIRTAGREGRPEPAVWILIHTGSVLIPYLVGFGSFMPQIMPISVLLLFLSPWAFYTIAIWNRTPVTR